MNEPKSIDTSNEACERACADIITHWGGISVDAPRPYQHAIALIHALCAERDEAVKDRGIWKRTATKWQDTAEAAQAELSSLRAKGCGVSEEAIATAFLEAMECGYGAENKQRMFCDDLSLGDSEHDPNCACRKGWNAARALLQHAPQDAKLAAPMDVSIERLIERLRELEAGGLPWGSDRATCGNAARALESLSRRNEGGGRETVTIELPDAETRREMTKAMQPYRKQINETPELLSLLYDIDLLPEQIRLPVNVNRMIAVCEVFKRADRPLPPPPETSKEAQR